MAPCRVVSAFMLVCLTFAGCYESKVPLSPADASRIDERLLKNWMELGRNPGDKVYRVAISKFNEKEHLVVFADDDGAATIARAFVSRIGKVRVLNLQGIESPDPKDRTFVFFKYDFASDGDLRAWMIDRDSPLLEGKTFSSRSAFAAHIGKHVHDERLFGEMRRFKPVESMQWKLSP